MKHLCPICLKPMRLSSVQFRGQRFEAFECLKCKERIFSEKQVDAAIKKLESKRMKESYLKTPIRIGHSLGLTFPKDIVEVFGLDQKTKIKLKPDLQRGVIEIKCSC